MSSVILTLKLKTV